MTEPRAVTEDRGGEDGAVAEPRRYFDAIAGDYSAKYQEDSLWGHVLRERKRRLLELLDGTEEGKVLDVGCGPGVVVSEVLSLGCEYWGVDGSPQMIEECVRRYGADPRAHFEVMNAEALRFASGSFDAVMCIGVIDRVPRAERAIAEMARVLKPNGRLLISFPNLLSPYAIWRGYIYYPAVGFLKDIISLVTGRTWPPDLCSASPRLWTPGTARRIVERLVGPVQAPAYYNFELLASPLDSIFPTMAKYAAQNLERLHESPLRWLGAGFIVKAEKRA